VVRAVEVEEVSLEAVLPIGAGRDDVHDMSQEDETIVNFALSGGVGIQGREQEWGLAVRERDGNGEGSIPEAGVVGAEVAEVGRMQEE